MRDLGKLLRCTPLNSVELRCTPLYSVVPPGPSLDRVSLPNHVFLPAPAEVCLILTSLTLSRSLSLSSPRSSNTHRASYWTSSA